MKRITAIFGEEASDIMNYPWEHDDVSEGGGPKAIARVFEKMVKVEYPDL